MTENKRDQGDGDVVESVIRAESRRSKALVDGDSAALATLLAGAMTFVHASGRIDTRAGFLATLGKEVHYRSVQRRALGVRVFDSVAIMTGLADIVAQTAGAAAPVSFTCYVTQVWHRVGIDWQLHAYHASRTPSAERKTDQ